MDLAPYYNDAYQHLRPDLALREKVLSESRGLLQLVDEIKEKFAADIPWHELKVLEIGAGLAGISQHLLARGAKCVAVDFSPTALALARELAGLQGHELPTLCFDVGTPEAHFGGEHFDLIVDAHLLHCLALEPQRVSYLGLIREALSPRGVFIGETMVHRKKLYIPDGFMLDQQGILWQLIGRWTPVRRIADSLELEKEFQAAQLAIRYFMYYGNYSFAPAREFWDIPADILPASVRFALSRP